MKIKVLVSCSGLTFSYIENQVVDTDEHIALDLIKCGFAEEVKSNKNAKRDTKINNKTGDTKEEVNGDDNADT